MTPGQLLPALREDWERALCVAAHPDDIEYGAASVVAKWTSQGKSVAYLVICRGEAGIDGKPPEEVGPLREAEERAGATEVGVDTVEFLNYVDGVIEYGLPLRRDITQAIRRYRPEVILTGSFSERMPGGMANQADHRAVGLATLDAARDAGNRWIFRDLGLEPWGGVRYVCFGGAPIPTAGVDITGYLDRGIASLRAHAAYLAGLGDRAGDPAQFLTWIARMSGQAMGVEHAVLFDVYSLQFEGPPPSSTESGS